MQRVVAFLLAVMLSVVFTVRVQAQQDGGEPPYRLDPALNVAAPQPPAQPSPPPVAIDKIEGGANVRLGTEGPLSAYLGGGQRPELSPLEERLQASKKEQNPLSDYHLEAGIGLHAEDKASLMLGYRFSNPPSLLDERRSDPLTLSGELRITFGVKLPFD